jgi:hypothetical protein
MDKKLTRKTVLVLICIVPLTMGCILTNIARSALSDGQETSPTEQVALPTETGGEAVPTVEVTVPTIEPAEVVPTEETAQQPTHETICTEVDNLRICIPQGLADNLVVSTVPEFTAEMGAPWDVAPEHRLIDLQGYLITNAFWRPQIIIYPIEAYNSSLTWMHCWHKNRSKSTTLHSCPLSMPLPSWMPARCITMMILWPSGDTVF